MSRVCRSAVFLAFFFAVSVAWSAEENDGTKQSDAKPTSVVMKSISYDPKRVEVSVGGSVVWTNKAVHKPHRHFRRWPDLRYRGDQAKRIVEPSEVR